MICSSKMYMCRQQAVECLLRAGLVGSRTDAPAELLASEPGGMFISADKINDIKSQPQQDGKYLVAVTDAFKYGQLDGAGKGRFLVLHDPSRMIFMVSASVPRSALSFKRYFDPPTSIC